METGRGLRKTEVYGLREVRTSNFGERGRVGEKVRTFKGGVSKDGGGGAIENSFGRSYDSQLVKKETEGNTIGFLDQT